MSESWTKPEQRENFSYHVLYETLPSRYTWR